MDKVLFFKVIAGVHAILQILVWSSVFSVTLVQSIDRCLLVEQMGKFYELFEMDAHVGAKELDLQYMKVPIGFSAIKTLHWVVFILAHSFVFIILCRF